MLFISPENLKKGKKTKPLYDRLINDIIDIHNGTMTQKEAEAAADNLLNFFHVMLETINDERG